MNQGWLTEPTSVECCYQFQVIPSHPSHFPWVYWIVAIEGVSSYITSFDEPDGKFEWCFDELGLHNVIITYVDANNETLCETNYSAIVTEICPGCYSYMCWEDFIGPINCVESVTIQHEDGSIETIPFTQTVLMTCFGTNGLPCGFNAVAAELLTAMNSAGFTGTFYTSDVLGLDLCVKECLLPNGDPCVDQFGNPLPLDPLPMFMFDDTNINILSVNGSNDCYGMTWSDPDPTIGDLIRWTTPDHPVPGQALNNSCEFGN